MNPWGALFLLGAEPEQAGYVLGCRDVTVVNPDRTIAKGDAGIPEAEAAFLALGTRTPVLLRVVCPACALVHDVALARFTISLVFCFHGF